MQNVASKKRKGLRALLVIALCLCAQPAMSKKVIDQSAATYSRLENETKKFEQDKKAQKFRHNYEKLALGWEAFARKYPKSPKVSASLVKAADLYERVAGITHFARDYKKTSDTLLAAAQKATVLASRDAILVRAALILENDLADKQQAKTLLSGFVKQTKTKAKQKQSGLPKCEALYAELMAKTQTVSKTKVAAKEPVSPPPVEEPAPLKLEKIEKVELLNSEKGVGLRISTTGSLHIKHGVIPKSGDAPRRVFFDFSRSELSAAVPLSFTIAKSGINQVRLGQFKDDIVRVVVEAAPATPFRVKADGNPIEIWFGEAAQVLAEEETPVKEEKEIDKEQAPLGLALRKIVIDPGHGGSDPGAIGRGGLREKDVTLAISKRLKASIEQQMPGVRVFLTRDNDKYVSLSERTQFANDLHADLFVSVHVNSSPNRKTQGIETYYLNISHDRYAVRLASRENAMSETEISNLEFILADLAMKANVSDSVRLGREVQSSVYGHMQGTWNDVKDLGLKHALFYVLLGARMPAVLVETAFISNHEDEKRLRTDRYQDAIVTGMVKGIRRYGEQKQAMYQP